ncbi:beta-glucosidase [Mesorhizobium australicum]|uniref:beta-glucosidase n=1 Tax=Mesorhizobium australicum TaxID=536018 RepID=UPI00333A4FCB
MREPTAFNSFFLGGFECSSHRRADGVRLDLLRATCHDEASETDYLELQRRGIRTVRDGLRWHLIEREPGNYDWSSFLPMLRAADATGTQVVWDLCHYGWPDHIDIFSPEFVERFARFAEAVARVIHDEIGSVPYFCPVNEISYWSWAGGDTGRINPCASGLGGELKRILVRAAIAAMDAIRRVDSRARFITAEPLINVVGYAHDVEHQLEAERYRLYQFEALDMLAGIQEPELGGRPEYLDIVGVNFYPDNQWLLHGPTIPFGDHAYKPLADMLVEVAQRYNRPVFISETGAERTARPSWFHYVVAEVVEAMQWGVQLEGICLYPIIDYPGWENGRMCDVGLLGPMGEHGRRPVCQRMADELAEQSRKLLTLQRELTSRTYAGGTYAVSEASSR